jgi:type IV pilus assembly protein PilW
MQLIGVGADATLFGYDMLRLDGTDAARPLADGVADLRALYGIDSNNDGQIDAWVAPTDANFTAAALTAGTLLAQQRVMSIMAVRIGLVLRSDRIEREDVAPASITLFTDLPAGVQHTHNIAAGDRRQRFRGVEFTVPLRNVMLAAR